jgi:hypothetical protein
MEQEQRFAVVTALPYCQDSAGRFHQELLHAGILGGACADGKSR